MAAEIARAVSSVSFHIVAAPELLAREPDRVAAHAVRSGPLYFNFARQSYDAAAWQALVEHARQADLAVAFRSLFDGEKVNVTEERAALHTALRSDLGASATGRAAHAEALAARLDDVLELTLFATGGAGRQERRHPVLAGQLQRLHGWQQVGGHGHDGVVGQQLCLAHPQAVAQLLARGARYIDTRTEPEFKAGHVPGAKLVPYVEKSPKDADYDASMDQFDVAQLGSDRNAELVFACNGAECWKSYKASHAAITR